MSSHSYKLLRVELQNLKDTVELDSKLVQECIYNTIEQLIEDFENIYLRYLKIGNNISLVCDQISNPNEHVQAIRLWELTAARALQIALELTEHTHQLFQPSFQALLQHKITVRDLQFNVPEHYTMDKTEIFPYLDQDDVLMQDSSTDENQDPGNSISNDLIEAADVLSSRRESEESLFESRRIKKKIEKAKDAKRQLHINKKCAAIIFYYLRRFAKRVEFRNFLGMIASNEKKVRMFDEKVHQIRKTKQKKLDDLNEAVTIKTKQLFSDELKEDIEDEIRSWYSEWFEKNGTYPSFPQVEPLPVSEIPYGIPKQVPKERLQKIFPQKQNIPKNSRVQEVIGVQKLGGSALIVSDNWITPEEFMQCQNENEKREKTGSVTDRQVAWSSKKEGQKELEIALKPTDCFPAFQKNFSDFELEQFLVGHLDNVECNIKKRVKDNVMTKLKEETRKLVDESMRKELAKLSKVLGKESGTKKAKKRKRGAGKRKNKKPEIPEDVLKEYSLQLVTHGILKRSEHKDKYVEMDAEPSVTSLLERFSVLPLVSPVIHSLVPLTRSTCIIGADGMGKRSLIEYVATKTASTIFDLTPSLLHSHYPKSADINLLAKILPSLARKMQPSIIFVEDAEKLFYKKVPKAEKAIKPTSFAKLLNAIVKIITAETQVMIMATSSAPWLAKSTFSKFFDLMIPLPFPAYGIYSKLWENFIDDHYLPQEAAPLAKVSTKMRTQGRTITNIVIEPRDLFKETADKLILPTLANDTNTIGDTEAKLKLFLQKTPLAEGVKQKKKKIKQKAKKISAKRK